MRRIVEYDTADGPVGAALLAQLPQRGLPVVDPEPGGALQLPWRGGVNRYRGGREGSWCCRSFAGGTNCCYVIIIIHNHLLVFLVSRTQVTSISSNVS